MSGSIELTEILTSMCQDMKLREIIDDLPPLSTHERSLDIWKRILEFNHSDINRYLPNPSKKINERSLSIDLRLWICSLDYSRGIDVLLHVTSERFLRANIEYFLINLNYLPIKSYVAHRVVNKPSHILNLTLDMRLSILPKVHRRFAHLVTQENQLRTWILNYDEICDSLCYLIYYLNRLNVKFVYPFETLDSYMGYIQYAIKKRYLGGLMNSPKYSEILRYLQSKFTREELIEMHIENSIFYDREAHDTCQELFGPLKGSPRLNSGIHLVVLNETFDRTTELSHEDIGPIGERLMLDGRVPFEDKEGTIYLCWSHLRIDRIYLESVLMYLNVFSPTQPVYFKVKSSNIEDPCGSLLKKIREKINVNLELDYENTPIHILHDLIYNGGFIPGDLNSLIVHHKDDLLRRLLSNMGSANRKPAGGTLKASAQAARARAR